MCSVSMCLWQCLHCDCVCVCLRRRIHVCDNVCLYDGCVVFVCVPGHVCMAIAGYCVNGFMFVNACACMVIVLCLYASLAMLVC